MLALLKYKCVCASFIFTKIHRVERLRFPRKNELEAANKQTIQCQSSIMSNNDGPDNFLIKNLTILDLVSV